jgi:hypothetical protein
VEALSRSATAAHDQRIIERIEQIADAAEAAATCEPCADSVSLRYGHGSLKNRAPVAASARPLHPPCVPLI